MGNCKLLYAYHSAGICSLPLKADLLSLFNNISFTHVSKGYITAWHSEISAVSNIPLLQPFIWCQLNKHSLNGVCNRIL